MSESNKSPLSKRGGSRRSEWNHENDKASKRLNVRIKDYEKTGKGKSEGFNKPGSMKCY